MIVADRTREQVLEHPIFQHGYLLGLASTRRAIEEGDQETLEQCAESIRRNAIEIKALREGLEDFFSQIEDCRTAHEVCPQFTTLADTIKKNLEALNEN